MNSDSQVEVADLGANSKHPSTAVSPAEPADFGTGWKLSLRLATSFLSVLIVVLISVLFIFSMYRPDSNDPDIWWHMRNAQYLFAHHHFPRTDMYSFTVSGHPWINHEWLSEIPFYAAYRWFGLVGIKSFSFILLNVILLLLLYLCYQESRNFKASAAVCYYSTLLATVSFGPRTILFGYVYLVVLLIVLERFRRLGSAPLWVIPVLFGLWINSHGSWLIGLIIFFLFCVSGLTTVSLGRVESLRWTNRQFRQLALTGLLSVAALFINPFGWRLVHYPFDLAFKQTLNIATIQEWVSVDFHDLRGKLALGLIFGVLLGGLLRNRRWDLGELLTVLFALYLGLTYIRFLVLLAIVAAPVLAKELDFFPPYRPENETPKLNLVVILLLIGVMIYFRPREARIRQSVEQTYPSGAITYMKEHPPQGNVLNLYLWGGYLGWNDPSLKVFIDSRVDIFEYAGVLNDYLTLVRADSEQHRPDSLLDKYKIRYVLFPPSDSKNPLHAGGELVYVLEHDVQWKKIYQDKVSVLMMKQ